MQMPKIQMRRDTAANWKSVNPVLLSGEWALETDTKKMKIGDGSTAYNALPYSTAEDSDEWQKPSDWMDIRSGAIAKSVYFLVGHSADYSTYPAFPVRAGVSNSGTYDVYVDGIKQATTAHNTTTTLNWQTLNLSSGWDVTYPKALRTHIVRVTPTDSSNYLKNISTSISPLTQHGLLWVHFTTNERISASFGSTNGIFAPLLESITTNKNDEWFADEISNLIGNLPSVRHLPIINCEGANFKGSYAFYNTTSPLKKIRLKKCKFRTVSYEPFTSAINIEEIETDDCLLCATGFMFKGMQKLKKLPSCIDFSNADDLGNFLTIDSSLQDTVLDITQGTLVKRFIAGASSTTRVDGLKGLIVSNNAPFDHATSPQINVSYTGLDRAALVNLFNSMPTVSAGQVCNITGATGAGALTAEDLAIAVNKGWTIAR